jgi:hypothetical protein
MPYDFAGGFNQGQYNPQGYAGRQQGGRFAAYYGRDENGNLLTGPSGQAQAAPAAPAAPGMNQGNPQADFFSQLAGLLGGGQGGAPSTSTRFGESRYQNVTPGNESIAYAKTLPPAQYNDYMGKYGNRDFIASGGQNAGRQEGFGNMPPPTTQGPGSYSRAVQEGGMRGRATALGRTGGGRTNPGQTNPGGMAPPLRPRGPMPMPNKPRSPMGMDEAKPMEGMGRMAPPLQTSPTAMPKPRPLPNMKPGARPMGTGPAQGTKRPGRFGEMGTSRRSAAGYGGGF